MHYSQIQRTILVSAFTILAPAALFAVSGNQVLAYVSDRYDPELSPRRHGVEHIDTTPEKRTATYGRDVRTTSTEQWSKRYKNRVPEFQKPDETLTREKLHDSGRTNLEYRWHKRAPGRAGERNAAASRFQPEKELTNWWERFDRASKQNDRDFRPDARRVPQRTPEQQRRYEAAKEREELRRLHSAAPEQKEEPNPIRDQLIEQTRKALEQMEAEKRFDIHDRRSRRRFNETYNRLSQ